MTDQTGRRDPELPAASLEERVHKLEERLTAVAEPGRRPTTEAARRAYELLLIAEPRELRPGAASPMDNRCGSRRPSGVTWRCQPVKDRPSKWARPRPVFSSR
jgi:hypothetical protein